MKTRAKPKTIFDPRYKAFIADLIDIRKKKNLSQRDLAKLSGEAHGYIGRVEVRDRRLDILETIDLMKAMKLSESEMIELIRKLIRSK